jgi:hypothetical protein
MSNNNVFKSNVAAYLRAIAELEEIKKREGEIVERLKTLYESVKLGMVERNLARIVDGTKEIRCTFRRSEVAEKKEIRKARLLEACNGNEQNARKIWEICNAKKDKTDYFVDVTITNPLTNQVTFDQIA